MSGPVEGAREYPCRYQSDDRIPRELPLNGSCCLLRALPFRVVLESARQTTARAKKMRLTLFSLSQNLPCVKLGLPVPLPCRPAQCGRPSDCQSSLQNELSI
jgi:hypothetical protein